MHHRLQRALAHAAQEVAPGWLKYAPAWHGEQKEKPTCGWYLPAGQARQVSLRPNTSLPMKLPAAQAARQRAREADENLPLGQLAHADAPACSVVQPASHSAQPTRFQRV